MENTELIVRKMFAAALAAVEPQKVTADHGEKLRTIFTHGGFSRLLVLGFGKAALPMAMAMEEGFGESIDQGVVVTSYGNIKESLPKRICVIEAGHPAPDENGLRGAGEIIRLAEDADERTLAIVLISGGGSALFVSPAEGMTLREKQETTSLLLRAGADIGELNTVRKHISRVKGGRLAELLHPATTVSLILSDVIGDRLDVIASGPTSPDPSTFVDAIGVLEKYDLTQRIPESVAGILQKGASGGLAETPKADNPIFRRVENIIVGSNRLALDAAVSAATGMGMDTEVLSASLAGEASTSGRRLAVKALTRKLRKVDHSPLCLLSGGETTVTVRGKGKGGRSMELALAFALEIEGTPGITLLSAGTDGIDGPTDAAGAIVDGMTAIRGRKMGLEPEAFLRDNDSYNFFRRAGGLLFTGPTGTNVMDLQIIHIA